MQLQFLNLSQPSRRPIVHMIDGMPVQFVGKDNHIHSGFSFTLPCDPDDYDEKRNRSRDLKICNRIAEGLRSNGLEIGRVGPAKPSGGAINIKMGNFAIVAIISAKRLPQILKCDAFVFTQPLCKVPVEPTVLESEWATAAKAMTAVIQRDLNGGALAWEAVEN